MKYIIYITTNNINNKIYIGVHSTETPYKFDGYLGCGAFINKPSSYNKGKTHFHNAILKYGKNSFIRKTLMVFDSLEEALKYENIIVNDDFVRRNDTYNMTIGGANPPILSKKVYQFNLKGEMIRSWDSVKTITDYYSINKDRITMCITSMRSYDDSYWSFNDGIKLENYRISFRDNINQYDLYGNLLNNYKNSTEASIKLDIDRNSISNAVYNRTVCCGYYFLRSCENVIDLINEKSTKKLLHITPVYRFDITGELNFCFKSIKDAVINTNKASHGNIIRAIKNNKLCAGYK